MIEFATRRANRDGQHAGEPQARIAERTGGHIGPTTSERIIAAVEVVVPLAGVVVAISLLWGRGVSGLDLALLTVMYSVTTIGIGAGFHRYFSHDSFETYGPVRAALAIAGSMAGQGPVKFWVGLHRIHHAKSDQKGDPHSPHLHGEGLAGRLRGFVYAHIGWNFAHDADSKERAWCAMSFRGDRLIRIIDKLYLFWVFLGLALPAAIGGVVTGTWWGAFTGFLWGGLVRMFLVNHTEFSINSICHLYGPRPYQSRDESRNNVWVGLLAFGDGWHNNHHKFPTSAMHGLEWWQFDLNGYLILVLEKLGLAWNVKRPSPQTLEKAAAETREALAAE